MMKQISIPPSVNPSKKGNLKLPNDHCHTTTAQPAHI